MYGQRMTRKKSAPVIKTPEIGEFSVLRVVRGHCRLGSQAPKNHPSAPCARRATDASALRIRGSSSARTTISTRNSTLRAAGSFLIAILKQSNEMLVVGPDFLGDIIAWDCSRAGCCRI